MAFSPGGGLAWESGAAYGNGQATAQRRVEYGEDIPPWLNEPVGQEVGEPVVFRPGTAGEVLLSRL